MQKNIGEVWHIETCNSGTKVAVLHAKTTDEGWDPYIDTSNPDANHFVFQAQKDRRGLGPIETINSGHKVAVLHAKPQMRAGSNRDS